MLHLHLTKLLGTKLLGGSLDDVSGQWVWAAHDTNWIYQDGPAPNREVYYNQYVPRPWGSVARCAAMASVCGGSGRPLVCFAVHTAFWFELVGACCKSWS